VSGFTFRITIVVCLLTAAALQAASPQRGTEILRDKFGVADQLPLLDRKELRTAWRTRADVVANLECTDKF
jgi:hypothetical protein